MLLTPCDGQIAHVFESVIDGDGTTLDFITDKCAYHFRSKQNGAAKMHSSERLTCIRFPQARWQSGRMP
jgi:hypothetical protein